MKEPMIIEITGPAGCGKTSIANLVKDWCDENRKSWTIFSELGLIEKLRAVESCQSDVIILDGGF